MRVIGWIFYNKSYDKLRTLNGCSGLKDLNSTPNDCEYIKRMFKGFGVKDEDLHFDPEATQDDLNNTWEKKIKKASNYLSSAQTEHLILIYCGGHGSSDGESVIYHVNSGDAATASFNIQYRCEKLVGSR